MVNNIDLINEIIIDIRATGLYTEEFLIDLEDGLRKSSYAKKSIKNNILLFYE